MKENKYGRSAFNVRSSNHNPVVSKGSFSDKEFGNEEDSMSIDSDKEFGNEEDSMSINSDDSLGSIEFDGLNIDGNFDDRKEGASNIDFLRKVPKKNLPQSFPGQKPEKRKNDTEELSVEVKDDFAKKVKPNNLIKNNS